MGAPMNDVRAAPVGYCIYCDKRDGKFTDEHVVPYALGGLHILPEASCIDCQRGINESFESPSLQHLLVAPRVRYGYPSRKNKRRETVPVTVLVDRGFPSKPTVEVREVPAQGYDGPVFMQGISSRPWALGFPRTDQWHTRLSVDLGRGFEGLTVFPSQKYNSGQISIVYARMLAKIGHAYAHYEGVRFVPLLHGIIRGIDSDAPKYIGQSSAPPYSVSPVARYYLGLRHEKQFVVVTVELFSNTPVAMAHDVVVGTRPGWAALM